VVWDLSLLEHLPPQFTRAGSLLHRILPFAFRAYHQQLGLERICLNSAVAVLAAFQEDLFQMASRKGINFKHATETGVLFYMIGALSQYGKLGMTCIGDTAEEAQEIFDRTVRLLDDQTEGNEHGVAESIFEHYLNME